MSSSRYAIYWAPPADSLFWQECSRWLGRDCYSGQTWPKPDDLDAATWNRLTALPRKYGLHATLKAPFRLQSGQSEAALLAQCATFAQHHTPFTLHDLDIAPLGHFIAIRPQKKSAALLDLADDCVRDFDPFREPAQASELSRRRAAGLNSLQENNLLHWGYPHVFADYRFHLTITDALPSSESRIWLPLLRQRLGFAIPKQTRFEAISLFMQPAADLPFSLVRQFNFQEKSAAKTYSDHKLASMAASR